MSICQAACLPHKPVFFNTTLGSSPVLLHSCVLSEPSGLFYM